MRTASDGRQLPVCLNPATAATAVRCGALRARCETAVLRGSGEMRILSCQTPRGSASTPGRVRVCAPLKPAGYLSM